jgi:hypothetical protein
MVMTPIKEPGTTAYGDEIPVHALAAPLDTQVALALCCSGQTDPWQGF